MKKLIGLLSVLFACINILGIVICFSFNFDFYVNHINKTEITKIELADAKNVYDFIEGSDDLNNNFDKLEYSHLKDVKGIFSLIYNIFVSSIILFLFISFYFIYSSRYNLIFRGLFVGSIISLFIVGILLLASIINFNYSFDLFHKIFFPQGNWAFAIDSKLINIFPESFFIAISRNIFVYILGISFLIIGVYFFIRKSSLSNIFINKTKSKYKKNI